MDFCRIQELGYSFEKIFNLSRAAPLVDSEVFCIVTVGEIESDENVSNLGFPLPW